MIIAKGSNNFPKNKLKDIIEIYKLPVLPKELINFCCWLSDWYMSDISHVLKMVIPAINFISPIKTKQILEVNKKSIVTPTFLGKNSSRCF